MAIQTPVSAAEGRERVEGGARIIDVRSDGGRVSAGTVVGAELVAKDAVAEFAASTPKDAEIVVFCRTTAGSGPVVDFLDEHGFTNVVHVDGGFEALRDAGLRVEPATDLTS
jgi:rhodanese-related sulfurtransferase